MQNKNLLLITYRVFRYWNQKSPHPTASPPTSPIMGEVIRNADNTKIDK
jgi:hypothetical protein